MPITRNNDLPQHDLEQGHYGTLPLAGMYSSGANTGDIFYFSGSNWTLTALSSSSRVGVRKNSAGSTFERRRINLIEGTNVTLTVADDAANEEVDVTIAATGGGGTLDPYRHHSHGQFLYAVHRDSNDDLHLLGSDDGITFTDVGGGKLFTPDVTGNAGADPSIIHHDGWWWIAFTGFTSGTSAFTVYKSRTLEAGSWTKVIEVDMSSVTSGSTWAPEWFFDPSTGDVHVFVSLDPSGGAAGPFQIYETHPTNRDMTTWTAPTVVTGTSLPSDMIDAFMVYAPEIGTAGKPYKLWYKDETNKHIEYAESAALTSGFTVVEDGDWAGWFANKDAGANSIEGPALVRLDDGRWRIYLNENNGFNSIRVVYSESTDDWATWTTQAVVTTPWLAAHGTVIRLTGMLDHEQDRYAHPAIISDHTTAADPHTGYQKESEKGAASGYASLDGTTKVPTAQLGTGTADGTTFLRGDQSWAVVDTTQTLYEPLTSGDDSAPELVFTADGRVIMVPVGD